MFTFIEHPTFTKQIESLFADDEYRRLQTDLAANQNREMSSLALLVCVNYAGARKVKVNEVEPESFTYSSRSQGSSTYFTHTPKATSRT